MENKTTLSGYPIHPILIIIPLGFFFGVIIFDTIFLFTKNPMLPAAAFLSLSVGIIGGFLAAIFGFHGWLGIPDNTAAQKLGVMHGLNMLIILLLFVVSWWLRSRGADFVASPLALSFSYIAMTLAILAALVRDGTSHLHSVLDDDIFDDATDRSIAETLTRGISQN